MTCELHRTVFNADMELPAQQPLENALKSSTGNYNSFKQNGIPSRQKLDAAGPSPLPEQGTTCQGKPFRALLLPARLTPVSRAFLRAPVNRGVPAHPGGNGRGGRVPAPPARRYTPGPPDPKRQLSSPAPA